jgi:hypothetical protein
MNQSYIKTTKIISAIARNHKIPSLVGALYLFGRSFDVYGSGNVSFDVAELARLFKRTISTIKANLRLARRLGVFRLVTLTGMTARVNYLSLNKLCIKFDIKHLGATFELFDNELTQIRSQVIRMTTNKVQAQSIYRANVKAKEQKLPEIIKPSEIFESASEHSHGVTAYKGRQRDLLLVDSSFTPYGASQATIANNLGCHRQTVSRHLGDINNLGSVPRFQVLVKTRDDINSADLYLEHPVDLYSYCFVGKQLYKRHCNIYDVDKSYLISDTATRAKVLEARGDIPKIEWVKNKVKNSKAKEARKRLRLCK